MYQFACERRVCKFGKRFDIDYLNAEPLGKKASRVRSASACCYDDAGPLFEQVNERHDNVVGKFENKGIAIPLLLHQIMMAIGFHNTFGREILFGDNVEIKILYSRYQLHHLHKMSTT
jgi:hypothetical protein